MAAMTMPAVAPELSFIFELDSSGAGDPRVRELPKLVLELAPVPDALVGFAVLFDDALKRAANWLFWNPDNGLTTVAPPVGLYCNAALE
jgi:hypothetical protein